MRTLLALSLFLVSSAGADEDAPPCSAPEYRQFDFWLGEWDLTWGEDGRGTNVIERRLGDCVIQENFAGGAMIGMSVSTWVPQAERWKQTWVDNQGGYLDFVGGMEGDRMVLSRTAVRGGAQVLQRMTFYNIAERSLDWDWETSTDDGASWDLRWRIHYERKTP